MDELSNWFLESGAGSKTLTPKGVILISKIYLPLLVRSWRWWCEYGPRRASGGTIGGSFLFRLLKEFYRHKRDKENPDGVLVIDDQHYLYVDPLDFRTYLKIIPELDTDEAEIKLARYLTPPGGTYLDVGANVGVMSLLALSGGACSVHSFEPNPSIFSKLKKTRSANAASHHWHIYPIGIGETTESLVLHCNPLFSGTASLQSNWQGGGSQTITVSIDTLDNWFTSNLVETFDVLKLDVEGWEHQVLTGGSSVIQRQQPYIWLEYNLPSMKAANIDSRTILLKLRQFGYKLIFDIGVLPERRPISFDQLERLKNKRVNLLLIPDCRKSDFEIRVLKNFSTQFSGI